tara:strand:+ start:11696 stop:12802 length:1107 start_codon:yes stop_codon:yes gene_type:complete
MSSRIKLDIILIVLFFLVSCSYNPQSKKENSSFLPRATGENNEMLIVMDSSKFKGSIGRALVETYGEFLRGLPQPETRFDLIYIKPRKFNNILKHAKNIVIAFTLEGKSLDSEILRKNFNSESLDKIKSDSTLFYFSRRDQYAKGQTVLYLFSKSDDDLLKKIKKNKSAILKYFEDELKKRVDRKIFSKLEKNISDKLFDDHQIKIKIPYGYDLAKNIKGENKNFFWLRQLDSEFEKNIFLYYEEYEESELKNFYDVFNADEPNIKRIRNKISKSFLKDSENSKIFMSIQDVFPITSKKISFKGNSSIESVGLWKLSDISAGGPFKSIIIYNSNKKRVYYLEGYVYAPGSKKRNLMQEISSILMTFEI